MRDALGRAGLTALGGALAVAGALMTWATVRPSIDAERLDPSVVRGPDLPEGWVALALAVAIVVGAAAMLLVTSPRPSRALGATVLLASIAIAGIGAIDALAGEDRLRAAGLDRTAARITEATGLPFDPVRRRLDDQLGDDVDVSLGAGLVVVIAGGVVGAVGSVGALLTRQRARPVPPS